MTLDFIETHPELADEIVWRLRPHKGTFIGNAILLTDIDCEDKYEFFESLQIGDKLSVCGEASKSVKPFEVKTFGGVSIGFLPFAHSSLLSMLMSRKLECFCFLEAKRDLAGVLSLAVSLYCEDY